MRVALLTCALLGAVVLSSAASGPAQAAALQKHSKQEVRKGHRAAAPKAAHNGDFGWDFKESDKGALNNRWRESINNTLSKTTFAPTAPAGRYLRQPYSSRGNLPPAHIEDLDKLRPAEAKSLRFGDANAGISPEINQESIGWRATGDSSIGAPPLKEERTAGAYADLHPDEDVEVKLGPEYRFGDSSLRPDQTGYSNRESSGSMGMGMKFKLDF